MGGARLPLPPGEGWGEGDATRALPLVVEDLDAVLQRLSAHGIEDDVDTLDRPCGLPAFRALKAQPKWNALTRGFE